MSVPGAKGYRSGRYTGGWIATSLRTATGASHMRLAGLASNRGRNLINIHDRAPGGAQFAVLLTNDADAPICDKAAQRGIPVEVVERDAEESRQAHEHRINEVLAAYEYDLVCLDGYMRILSETFLTAQPTTLNVHPALLPAFPGTDAWGQALDTGVDLTGCTVHVVTDATDETGAVVDERVDAGPIVTQEPVPVYEGDDPETLKQRVLYEGEFAAYPRAVEWFADDRVVVDHTAETVKIPENTAEDRPMQYLQTADRVAMPRYGENPHQKAAVYADYRNDMASVVDATQHNAGAKALSYNNYNDADAALGLVAEFDDPAAVVIKHTNPAGAAVADSVATAYRDALATDAKSAFGGIVALNRPCDAETANAITESFKEVVVAPSYTEPAITTLTAEDNLRVLEVGPIDGVRTGWTEKAVAGGRLVQQRDDQTIAADELEVVTERSPTAAQIETMQFAWQTIKHVKSNAIVIADGTETVGIGAGQVSRVDAVEIAKRKAADDAEGKSAAGGVLASDAFFPFPDGIDAAAEAGIEAVVQPGGSVNDDKVIEAANDHGMAMAFTGQRCFRHD